MGICHCRYPLVIVPVATRAAVDSATPDARLLNFEAYLYTTDHIAIESSNGDISRVRVGGTSVFVAEGTMEVEE